MKKIFILAVVLSLFIPVLCLANDPCCEENKEIPYPTIQKGGNYFVQDGVGYYLLSGTIMGGDFNNFVQACMIFDRFKIKKIVIILNSPGGSVFDAIGFMQVMATQKSNGVLVETRCYGLAASAAAIIMSAGSRGNRYIAEGSFIMVHELSVFKFLAEESVSDTEKQAKIERQIQNEIISILAKNTNLTQEELTRKCKDESWADAKTSIKWGFADNLIK